MNTPPERRYSRTTGPDADTRALRLTVWDKTEGRCWYCGDHLNQSDELCLDHVVPLSAGGLTTLSNLVPACRPCNATQHGRSLERFRYLMMTRLGGVPRFTDEQIAYLAQYGIVLPDLPWYAFYFERNHE
jgi:5-methylcytosine-specific restriction endonuclease McrA